MHWIIKKSVLKTFTAFIETKYKLMSTATKQSKPKTLVNVVQAIF